MDADFMMSDKCPPLLLCNTANDWPAMSWTPSTVAKFLPEKKFKCRIGPKEYDDLLWEADCIHEDVTMLEFCEWLNGHPSSTSALSQYSKDDFWAYIDYKSMKDMFHHTSTALKSVRWGNFGLTGRDGEQSTIWIGSEGAYTPCHYDTYGFNLVAQIYGRKRWVLIPPTSTGSMYPTRLPYEESSVFSDINFLQPNLTRHSKLKMVQPYVITLEPGQVLYVPHHWWHFVECLEPSISINTWVELPEDDKSRHTESVTRTLYSLLRVGLGQSSSNDWLNPTENILPHEVNMAHLLATFNRLHQHRAQTEAAANTEQTNLEKFVNFVTQKCKIAPENVVHVPNISSSTSECKTSVCKGNVMGDLKRNAGSIDNDDAILPAKYLRINENNKCSCTNSIKLVPGEDQSPTDIAVDNETKRKCDKDISFKSEKTDIPIYAAIVHLLKSMTMYDYIRYLNRSEQDEHQTNDGNDRCDLDPEEFSKGDNFEHTEAADNRDNATDIRGVLTTEMFIKSILDPQVILSITKVLEENMK